MVGAFFLTFGVCSVVYGKADDDAAGFVVGGSLLLGILIASAASNGVINPAVAVGVGSISFMYILGPIVGGILAAQAYQWLCGK
jgi:glycerol uptake facilitator-like aquaporin